jgi:predicted transcriptional regulator
MGNQFYTENADSKVLAEIIKSGKEGIYQKDTLARIPDIHRSTVNRVTRRLKKTQLARTEKAKQ